MLGDGHDVWVWARSARHADDFAGIYVLHGAKFIVDDETYKKMVF